ncbi:RCC1 domain-containing protein [Paenibacillus sp. 2TAB19]|uniref:RCC1 domain-containing protein n=1 Tax=Paenibacillus sp. 2TAB19 TaxID=3233003 RepID=UPI003F9B9923
MKRLGYMLLCAFILLSAIHVPARQVAEAAAATAVPQIYANEYSSVGLVSDGTVWSWGRGGRGQLGNGRSNNSSSPVKASGLSDARTIAATYASSFAVKSDGTVRAWGANEKGQLGDGTVSDRLSPVAVSGLAGIASVSSGPGLHTLAVGNDGKLWAWGNNEDGQLGDGTTDQRLTPVEVAGLPPIVQAAVGGFFSMALDSDGQVWSWGWNKQGQLGDGTADQNRLIPMPITGLSNIVAVSAGYNHALALDENGDVWAWGQNTNGAVGDGTYTERRTPVKVVSLDNVASISAGFFHNLVIKNDGTVWGWGYNAQYQLGNGSTEKTNSPIQVPGASDMRMVAAGQFHSLAMDRDGMGWAWGYNSGGLLGDRTGTDRPLPVQNSAVMDVTAPAVVDGALAVSDAGTSGLTVSWQKAADNMSPQVGLLYQVFFSDAGNIGTVNQMLMNGIEAGPMLEDIDSIEVTGLEPDQTYYFNVIVLDRAGNISAYAMQQGDTAPETVPDTEAPVVQSLLPANGSSLSHPVADLSLTFDEPVAAVADKEIVVHRADDDAVAATIDVADATQVAISGAIVSVRLEDPLPSDAAYYVLIDAGAFEDLAGNAFAGISDPSTWSFAVEEDTGIPIPSDDATLTSLIVNAGAKALRLSPAFAPDVIEYTGSVAHSVASVTITAAASDSHATVTTSVYDSADRVVFGPLALTDGEASDPLPLRTGKNRIELTVTAEDHSVAIYQITVRRSSAPATTPSPAEGEKPVVANVTFNGQEMNVMASGTLQSDDGRTTANVTVDTDKLAAQLALEDDKPVIRLTIETDVDQTSVLLGGQSVNLLRNKQAVLEIVTANGSYRLLAEHLPLDWLSDQFGTDVQLQDVSFQLVIAASNDNRRAQLQTASTLKGFAILTSPVDFRLLVSYGGKTIEADRFDAYAERELPMPEGVSPDGTVTAVVLESNGDIRHVPTRFIVRDGRYAAIASSLTNSSYALIRHSRSFSDVVSHWAESAINDMASRLIVSGVNNDSFNPNGAVSRAEFAAIMIRALGLPANGAGSSFTDVASSDWFAGTASIAQQYGIIEGEPDGNFRPNAPITRQEAAVIVSRAWQLARTGRETAWNDANSGPRSESFRDEEQIASWAKKSVDLTVQLGLFKGTYGSFLPSSNLTRAEAAAVVQRLLQQSGLIDG